MACSRALPRSYQVTPDIPDRRRATQQKEVRPTGPTASKRVSSPPVGTFSSASDVTDTANPNSKPRCDSDGARVLPIDSAGDHGGIVRQACAAWAASHVPETLAKGRLRARATGWRGLPLGTTSRNASRTSAPRRGQHSPAPCLSRRLIAESNELQRPRGCAGVRRLAGAGRPTGATPARHPPPPAGQRAWWAQ